MSSIMNNMLPPNNNNKGKRLFSTVLEAATAANKTFATTSTTTLPLEDIDLKRPRIVNNTVVPHFDPCCSTTIPNILMEEKSMNRNQDINLEIKGNDQKSTPSKQTRYINASIQTDLNLKNCVISPVPKPTPTKPNLISALISPPKTPTTLRTSPILTRAKSTVSISHVSNVSVSKKLISFSSMCSMDVPSTVAVLTKAKTVLDETINGNKREKISSSKAMMKRPRLKHTRTAAVDGRDELPEFGTSSLLMPNKKRCVDFGSVDVYSFEFRQSYDSIPTEGTIPLGMEDKHHDVKHYASYRDFQRERFAENTAKYSLDSSLFCSKKRRVKHQDSDQLVDQFRANRRAFEPSTSNSTCVSETKWTTSDEEFVDNKRSRSTLVLDKRRRQQIVIANKILMDQEINDECLRIKQSRLICGCLCQNGHCLPETCQCSLDGIGCLVDKPSFPCACTASSCQNPHGRHEFDENKVKQHYKETIKRVNADKRKEENSPLRQSSLNSIPRPNISNLLQSPLTHSFEKLELKTPSPIKPTLLQKSPSLGSKITTQFSQSSSISLPNSTPINVTKRKRYPVTPTFRQERDEDFCITDPSIIVLDDQSTMEIDQSVQFIEEIQGSSINPKRPKQTKTANTVEICELVITSPIESNTELPIQDNDLTAVSSINTQTSLLSASRSLSAATTTTDETTSRNSSTEEFIMPSIRID